MEVEGKYDLITSSDSTLLVLMAKEFSFDIESLTIHNLKLYSVLSHKDNSSRIKYKSITLVTISMNF